MESFIVNSFLTEYPNCELMSFGAQPLNLLTNLAFLVVAYLLYRKGGRVRWVALLAVLQGLGSLIHHLWPINETVPFDMIPAVAGTLVVFVLSYKRLTRTDWLQLSAVAAAAVLAFAFDTSLCALIPVGTHFVWHLLAAYAIYLLGRRV